MLYLNFLTGLLNVFVGSLTPHHASFACPGKRHGLQISRPAAMIVDRQMETQPRDVLKLGRVVSVLHREVSEHLVSVLLLFCHTDREQLGKRPLHGGRRAGGLGAGRSAQRGRRLRLLAGVPVGPLVGWGHRLWPGDIAHIQDTRGVP